MKALPFRLYPLVVVCLLLALLAPLLSACLLDTTPAVDAPPKTDSNPVVVDRPAQGKLRLYGADPITLDPSLVGDIGSYQYIGMIYSGLVTIDEQMKIAPDLATRWDISSDGKTYVFHLRDDAKFHNGSAITADAFKYAIERATDPRTRSQVAQIYLNDIVGVTDKLAGSAREVAGVRVKDPHTLEIEIDAPKAYFLAKLTYPTAYALDKSTVEGDRNWVKNPNGSGPFKLKSWQPEQSMVFQRNELYYGQKPGVAEVEFYLGGGSPVTMYERDELDVAEVGTSDIERVLDKRSSLNKDLVTVPELSLTYIGLNTTLKPFDDVKVRQAFAYATDKDKLANILLKKTRMKAKGILPPGMPGYNEALEGIELDPRRAQEILAQSSYGGAANLPEITMTVSAGGGTLAQSLAEMYRRNLGVEITVQQVDDVFHQEVEERKYQMFVSGWIADYPDQQDFLDVFFYSTSNGNYTVFKDPEIDQMLEAARVEQDENRRAEIYQDIESQVVQLAPMIPLFHDVEYALVKPRVKGLVLSPLGVMMLKNVSIER